MNNKPIPKKITDELFFTFETIYTRTRLENMAERYDFAEKIETFSKIVEETFYGKRPISELPKALVEGLGVSEEVARYLVIELDQVLFSERRLEFNVVQGFVTMDEIELVSDEDESEEEALDSSVPTPPKKRAKKDPIAHSVLEDAGGLKKGRDPYREPVEE